MNPSIALVTTSTRMQGLLARWGTKGAARFRIGLAAKHEQMRAGPASKAKSTSAHDSSESQGSSIDADIPQDSDFDEYEREDSQYQSVLEQLRRELDLGYPISIVERRYIANFDFRNVVLVCVLGHDGLVANVAKYATGLPMIGINPDPKRIDGVLTPFAVKQVRNAVVRTLDEKSKIRNVTMAQATMNDGQSLIAFNDFFIGRRSHASARYTLQIQGKSEPQSSSGVIVATGAGSTGWLSSVFNMMKGVSGWTGGTAGDPVKLNWEDRKLAWVVREPFKSKHSKTNLVAGMLNERDELVLESLMPESGVVFSDGIEEDFLEFNSGSIVRIRLAPLQAKLVVPQ